jgi:hypothetical protein
LPDIDDLAVVRCLIIGGLPYLCKTICGNLGLILLLSFAPNLQRWFRLGIRRTSAILDLYLRYSPSFYGQESIETTLRLGKMNLMMQARATYARWKRREWYAA